MLFRSQRLNAVRAAVQKFPLVPANKAILARLQGAPEWNVVRPPLVALGDEARTQLFGSLEGLGFALDGTAAVA